MAAMQAVGNGHRLLARANVCERRAEYVIELDVADFAEQELAVEAVGSRITVRGDHVETNADEKVFRFRERLEETFRLPGDAAIDATKVFYRHGTLEIHAPRQRLDRRRLRIEKPAYHVNPDAKPC
jgi:HSP20 family molecular chaperone IbpA